MRAVKKYPILIFTSETTKAQEVFFGGDVFEIFMCICEVFPVCKENATGSQPVNEFV